MADQPHSTAPAEFSPGNGDELALDAAPGPEAVPAMTLGSVDYPTGFYVEQTPVHLRYVAALHGAPMPPIDGRFDYCELGCGPGETVTMLAAAHPEGRFIGIDLMPAHIEYARKVVDSAQLTNVQLITADVMEFDVSSVPDFDFITMHGLYSWVPEPVQGALREFMRSKLKPDGLAYVSYNAMPGWSAVEPLRHFFVQIAERLEGDVTGKVRQILEMLVQLEQGDAPFFQENPVARQKLQRLLEADVRYVAHEFLGANWQPLYVEQMHEDMERAGLSYLGDADIQGSVLDPVASLELGGVIADSTDRRTRESLVDFALNRFFRRDVFKKSADSKARPGGAALDDILLGTTIPSIQLPERVNVSDNLALDWSGPWYDRVRALLAYRVFSVAELLADPELAEIPVPEALERLKRLTIGGFFAPFASREVRPPQQPFDRVRAVPRLNEVRLEQFDWKQSFVSLSSSVSGSVVGLNKLEAAFLLGLRHEDAVSWVQAQMRDRGMNIHKTAQGGGQGDVVEDEGETLEALREAFEQFTTHKLPKLAYMGVVEGY